MRKPVLFTLAMIFTAMAMGQSFRKIAREFRRQGNEDSCLLYALKMVEQDPGFKKNLQYAEWLADFGHCKKARDIMDELALKQRSEEKEVKLAIAQVYLLFRMDKDLDALLALHDLINRFPINKEVLSQAGFIYYALRDYHKALFFLEARLSRVENHTEVMLYAGLAHSIAGDTAKANAWFEKITSMESTWDYTKFSSYTKRLELYDPSLEYDPCNLRTCVFSTLRHYAALPLLCNDLARCKEMIETKRTMATYRDYFYFTHSPEFDLVKKEAWFKKFLTALKKGDLRSRSIEAAN